MPMIHIRAKYLPKIHSREKGKKSDIVPNNQLIGNIHKRLNGDQPSIRTRAIENRNSMVVLTVCLVIPFPDETWLLISNIQLKTRIEAIAKIINSIKFIVCFSSLLPYQFT